MTYENHHHRIQTPENQVVRALVVVQQVEVVLSYSLDPLVLYYHDHIMVLLYLYLLQLYKLDILDVLASFLTTDVNMANKIDDHNSYIFSIIKEKNKIIRHVV